MTLLDFAQPVVHTTGVNWDSISIIITAVVAAAGLILAVQERRQKSIREDIKDAVQGLGAILVEKLETKVTVAELRERVARLEGVEGIVKSPGKSGS